MSIELGRERNPPRPATPEQQAHLDSEERIDYGTRLLCDAYIELSTDRQILFGGIGPIPNRVIREWCDEHELDLEARQHVQNVLRLVDQETMRRANKSK